MQQCENWQSIHWILHWWEDWRFYGCSKSFLSGGMSIIISFSYTFFLTCKLHLFYGGYWKTINTLDSGGLEPHTSHREGWQSVQEFHVSVWTVINLDGNILPLTEIWNWVQTCYFFIPSVMKAFKWKFTKHIVNKFSSINNYVRLQVSEL